MHIPNGLKKGRPSTCIIIAMVVYVLIYGLNLKKYQKGEIIQHDVISYYAYLPALFIYHDLGFDFVTVQPENSPVTIWTHTGPSGKPTLKMTMGVAILMAPFFLLAHAIAAILGTDSNGYSSIYQMFILYAAVFYLLMGLIFLRKTLQQYFTEQVISVVLIIIVLGTNLFYYTSVEPGMSHVYSFALFAAGLWLTVQWFEQPGRKYSLLLGLVAGLILLLRPSNVVVFLVPVLLAIPRIRFVPWKSALIMLVVMFLVVFPQFLYWKFSTDQWIYYGYGDERFYFTDPEILKGLFSYRKGWLVYTPVMVFALAGFFFMKGTLRKYRIPVLVYLLVNLYVVFSWWCWWYGGGFGARPLIEGYVFLALPLGAFIERVWNARWLIRLVFGGAILFFIYLNLFQTRQYRNTLLHWDSTSRELYWNVFLSHQWPENYDRLLDPPDYENAQFRGE